MTTALLVITVLLGVASLLVALDARRTAHSAHGSAAAARANAAGIERTIAETLRRMTETDTSARQLHAVRGGDDATQLIAAQGVRVMHALRAHNAATPTAVNGQPR